MEKAENKKVLVLYTGGTIGMVTTGRGYAPRKRQFHDLLKGMPELYTEGMPKWEIHDMDPLLDSSNIAVDEWNAIGRQVAQAYDRYDGFVILHGTDTMAYTASALSFMLEGCGKPVILTGSQIPLCEIRSDGRDNLVSSILLAADDRIHEVCLYFGGKLLRGNRAMKYSADGLTAFRSPNYPVLAEAEVLVLAAPIYYFTLCAQIQAPIQRMYCVNKPAKVQKMALLMSSYSPDVYAGAEAEDHDICNYWSATDTGIVTAMNEEQKTEQTRAKIAALVNNL